MDLGSTVCAYFDSVMAMDYLSNRITFEQMITKEHVNQTLLDFVQQYTGNGDSARDVLLHLANKVNVVLHVEMHS